jgi:hypothetical protein
VDFQAKFICCGGVRFLLGFFEKNGVRGDVFVVSLWWDAWQSWSTDCHFFGCEEWDRMLKFFGLHKKRQFPS